MLILGNKTKFKFPNNKEAGLIDFESAIIYGKNGAGKTTLFRTLNKNDPYYDHSDLSKNLLLLKKNVLFLNNQIKIVKKNTINDYSKKRLEYISKIPFDILSKVHPELNLSFKKSVNIKNKIIVKYPEEYKKNLNLFNYFPILPKDFLSVYKNIINHYNQSKSKDEKEKLIYLIKAGFFNKPIKIPQIEKDLINIINVLYYSKWELINYFYNSKEPFEIFISKIYNTYESNFFINLKKATENHQNTKQLTIDIEQVKKNN